MFIGIHLISTPARLDGVAPKKRIRKTRKYLFVIFIAEIARCENEDSNLTENKNLVSLIPDIAEKTLSVNDTLVITCKGMEIRWKNQDGRYIDNLHGRVHVENNGISDDGLAVLQLFFERIEQKDSKNYTCEGVNGNKSFELRVYGNYCECA